MWNHKITLLWFSFEGGVDLKTIIKEFAIAAAVSFIVMQFIRPVNVMGSSMEPTLSSGDRAFVSRVAYKRVSPERGDIVVFKSRLKDSKDKSKILIKRIIGMPGDVINISDNEVSINGKVIDEPYINEGGTPGDVVNYVVPKDSYFVMGDNRTVSIDSRRNEVGPVHKDRIIGKALIRLYPFNKIGLIK